MVDRSNVIICGEIGTGKTHSLRSLHKYKNIALTTTDNDPQSVLGDIPCEGDEEDIEDTVLNYVGDQSLLVRFKGGYLVQQF